MTGFTFEAVVADITASAAGMTSAGETVRAADPTADLNSVATALEGSSSAAAATALVSTWNERFSTWATAADKHGTARLNSAGSYTRADHEAAARMRQEALANQGVGMRGAQ